VCTHSVQHAHNVFSVCERANLLVALPIDYSKRLQAQALHGDFGCKQKAMVEFIEELVPTSRGREGEGWIIFSDCAQTVVRLVGFSFRTQSYDLLMAFDSAFSSSSSSRRR